MNHTVVASLIAAFFGAGGLFALLFRFFELKRTHPLNEIATLSEIQKQIREEVRVENAGLRQEIHDLRLALSNLTQILDEVLPKIEGLSEEQKGRLHAARASAKSSLY